MFTQRYVIPCGYLPSVAYPFIFFHTRFTNTAGIICVSAFISLFVFWCRYFSPFFRIHSTFTWWIDYMAEHIVSWLFVMGQRLQAISPVTLQYMRTTGTNLFFSFPTLFFSLPLVFRTMPWPLVSTAPTTRSKWEKMKTAAFFRLQATRMLSGEIVYNQGNISIHSADKNF